MANTVLHCDCGFEVTAEDEEDLVAGVQLHALTAHGMTLTHDEALLLAFRAELDENAPAIPNKTTARRSEEEQ
jgi:Protein of unknown function (DUF1059)